MGYYRVTGGGTIGGEYTVRGSKNAVPVSYTHLDVYKRQGNLPEILPQHFCLLYTRFVDIRICPAIKHISLIHICLSMANQI